MRRDFLTFSIGGDTLQATIDSSPAARKDVGLLIVSGGNEIRSGAFAGQAGLARSVADHGYPAFRFDRRGVGDSEGSNGEYRSSEPDIRAAIAAFRKAYPSLRRIVGFGNCDGAAALMLANGANCDALVLANPWTFDVGNESAVPAAAARKRYAEKLTNPSEWMRILKGKVAIRAIRDALKSSVTHSEPMSGLAQELHEVMQGFNGHKRYLVAGRDRTGLAFKSIWPERGDLHVCAAADHAFSAPEDTAWLTGQILSALHEEARELDVG